MHTSCTHHAHIMHTMFTPIPPPLLSPPSSLAYPIPPPLLSPPSSLAYPLPPPLRIPSLLPCYPLPPHRRRYGSGRDVWRKRQSSHFQLLVSGSRSSTEEGKAAARGWRRRAGDGSGRVGQVSECWREQNTRQRTKHTSESIPHVYHSENALPSLWIRCLP
jgi:hypothetical protein